jgi:uncharacterized protein (TIGR02246 family)
MIRHFPAGRVSRRSLTTARTFVPFRALIAAGASLVLCFVVSGCDADPTSVPGTRTAAPANPSLSKQVGHHARPEDSAAVAAVGAGWDAAWNAGDGAGIGALFIDDGEIINGRGQLVSGAATITANHIANFAGVFHGSHSEGTVRRIVFLSENSALLEVDNRLTGFQSLPGGGIPTFPGLNLARHKRVLVKHAGQWRIMAMQITFRAAGTVAP